MTFLIESLVACAIFSLFVFLMSRDPVKTIFNYPPAIIERCKQLELVDEGNRPGGTGFYAKKIAALLVFGVLLGLLVRYVNGCTSFLQAFGTGFLLWTIVNLWDAIVLDILWFCHDPHFVLKGTEDMVSDYHDYRFHIKGFFIGEGIALIVCALAGLAVLIFLA